MLVSKAVMPALLVSFVGLQLVVVHMLALFLFHLVQEEEAVKVTPHLLLVLPLVDFGSSSRYNC